MKNTKKTERNIDQKPLKREEFEGKKYLKKRGINSIWEEINLIGNIAVTGEENAHQALTEIKKVEGYVLEQQKKLLNLMGSIESVIRHLTKTTELSISTDKKEVNREKNI